MRQSFGVSPKLSAGTLNEETVSFPCLPQTHPIPILQTLEQMINQRKRLSEMQTPGGSQVKAPDICPKNLQ